MHKGFDRGVQLHPERVSLSKLTNSRFYYRHEIEIANSRNMNICKYLKLGMLNRNLWSEMSCQEIFKNFLNEVVT